MFPFSRSRGAEIAETRASGIPRVILATIFCAFAALLPIVSVVAPKGTVGLLLLAAILAAPTYWWACRRFPVPDVRISIALVLLLAWCAIASAWSDEPVQSLVLAIRIAVIFAAGMILFAASAALDEAAKVRVGQWLVVGFSVGLAYMAVEIGLDYPLLRSFKEPRPGGEAVWFNRGAVALAMITWPLTAYLWERGVGWKALAIPVVLGISSVFLESESATLGLAVGVVMVLLIVAIPKAGRTVAIAASVLSFVAMPFAAREMYGHGWHQADWLISSAQHRVEIWDFTLKRIAEKPLLGWGFDASRHLDTLYPETSDAGRTLAALHPHSMPLQVMLETGAVGAVIALGLLCLLVMRLEDVCGRARDFGQAAFVAALAMGTVAYGAWQNWWLSLIVSMALLVPLVAAPGPQNGDGIGNRAEGTS